MVDQTLNTPVIVKDGGTGGPYIRVSKNHLPVLRSVLERNQVKFWVDEESLSVNGGPYVTWVNLGKMGRREAVQILLDAED